uniref:Uncharacterized protein n=1 Tax=Kwoniella pini CBS 10737 TaxID=1296096 RepID=A0A1B9I152_9TREE|nr:uncharacterized protein I206_04959 [Kwoniella pini CBS 10737]OCF49270.1 hypothetical protein I206_04959 [Kwoniella pini CBS 10737]
MTSTSRKYTLHLALPPRLALSRTDSEDSAPSTPGPHTPLPYDYGFFNASSMNTMQLDECNSINIGSKRGRDEDDDNSLEKEWTEEELDVLQAILIHPYKPVSTSYPPGELPPAKVIDELTNQIIQYAFRNTHSSPTEPTSRGRSRSKSPEERGKWTHNWDSTRKRLFDIALHESKLAFGFENAEEKKKMTREERNRPGLRRMDSMDFLDQAEDVSEKKGDNVGRAIRLSTTLQNSAKQEPLLSLTRSTSVAAITLTPASPTGPIAKPILRRKSSLRNLSTKPSRPTSLLQRGRSFTADDLRAEAETLSSEPEEQPVSNQSIVSPTSSEIVTSPITSTSPLPNKPSDTSICTAKLTRSQSSLSALNSEPHAFQRAFLQNPIPSTADRSTLILPLPDGESSPTTLLESPPLDITSSQSVFRCSNGGGWSDSEDEGPKMKQSRKVKKLRSTKGKLDLGGGLRGPQMLLPQTMKEGSGSLGLRSPFEEKDEPQFI